MDWSRPTPEGEQELAAVHRRLRAAGVPEGLRDAALAALELAVALLDWVSDAADITIGWRFTTADARITLKRLYPAIHA